MVATAAKRKRPRSTTAKPLWIVLTPSVDHEAWLEALSRAASNSGRELVQVWIKPEPDAAREKPVLYVTHDAAVAEDANPADVVVIMPQPETAAEKIADLYDLYLPHSMYTASMFLSKAMVLGPETRTLTAHQLARNPKQIELFPGLVVEPPAQELGQARPAVSTALSMYRLGRPQPGLTVAWSERLFVYDPNSCVEDAELGMLDISGRPRTLLFGPFLVLPPGRWKALMRFAVDEAAAQYPFRFDWGLATEYIDQTITPGEAGVYEIELDHTVEELGYWQFRVVLLQGAFDGRFMFQGGSVTRMEHISQTAA